MLMPTMTVDLAVETDMQRTSRNGSENGFST